jgi:hypothetical protein
MEQDIILGLTWLRVANGRIVSTITRAVITFAEFKLNISIPFNFLDRP